MMFFTDRIMWSPSASSTTKRMVATYAKKQQQKKKRSTPPQPMDRRIVFDGNEDADNERYVEEWGSTPSAMPQAPPTSTGSSNGSGGSEYLVFPPKPSNIANVRSGSWGWDEDESTSSEPVVPEWNPRTGFMGPPPTEAERLASSAGASSSGTASPRPSGELPDVYTSMLTPAAADAALPFVPRGQILSSCVGTGFWMTGLALFLRQYALINAPQVLGTDPKVLADMIRVPSGIESWENLGLAVGAVVLVTGARLQLIERWDEFRFATLRSNRQVLEPLGWLDIMAVATLTGASEEFLFRGAIIPGSFPDWRGAVLSGVIFGLLHNSGGRNLAFAGWAAAVGTLYGGLFVHTHNIWVPVSAHVLANFCSAAVWKASQK